MEKTADRTGSSRIEFLDSTRGLAALAVLFSHTVGILTLTPRARSLTRLPFLNAGIDGKAAAAMFFVLSGFVLSRPYLTSSGTTPARSLECVPFYAKRITRIYLPFLCALSLSALAKAWWFESYATVPPQSGWFLQFWRQPLGWPGFLKQCFFTVHDPTRQLMNQDWSLGIELKASALLPLLLFVFRRGERYLILIAGLFFFWDTGPDYVSFIMGIMLAAHLEVLVRLVENYKLIWLLVPVGLVCYQIRMILDLVFHFTSKGAEKWIWTATSLGCVLILLGIFGSGRLRKMLNHSFFVFLGRISYGVYLLQFIILLCIIPWLVCELNRWGVRQESILVPVAMMSSTLITIAAATVFYEAVEAPCIRLGHRFAAFYHNSKIKPKPKAAPVAAKGPGAV